MLLGGISLLLKNLLTTCLLALAVSVLVSVSQPLTADGGVWMHLSSGCGSSLGLLEQNI